MSFSLVVPYFVLSQMICEDYRRLERVEKRRKIEFDWRFLFLGCTVIARSRVTPVGAQHPRRSLLAEDAVPSPRKSLNQSSDDRCGVLLRSRAGRALPEAPLPHAVHHHRSPLARKPEPTSGRTESLSTRAIGIRRSDPVPAWKLVQQLVRRSAVAEGGGELAQSGHRRATSAWEKSNGRPGCRSSRSRTSRISGGEGETSGN